MAKPKRTFTGQEGQRSTGTAGPDAIRWDFDSAFAMFDPNATLPDGSAGGIGAENMQPGAATDEVIGDRTINDSTTPSGDTGKLTTLLSNLANRIQAIMGTSSWRSGPPTTLQAAKDHIDAPAPHSGHETPAGAQAKVDAHANRKDNPHQVTAAQVGAITSVAGISNPGGGVDIVAGSAISITKDTTNRRIVINAHTEGAAPGPHASTHASGGSDPITPAMIGAAPASHNHSASQITSGTLPVARGGTGLSSLTAGNYLRAASSSTFEQRTPAQVLSDIGAAPASHTHAWGDITGKPSTFPPSGHNHNDLYYRKSEIDSLLQNVARVVTGSYLGNGQAPRTITVGFTPKLVIVSGRTLFPGYGNEDFDAVVFAHHSDWGHWAALGRIFGTGNIMVEVSGQAGAIHQTVRIVTNGFQVRGNNSYGFNRDLGTFYWTAVG